VISKVQNHGSKDITISIHPHKRAVEFPPRKELFSIKKPSSSFWISFLKNGVLILKRLPGQGRGNP
jgi:hypothetical protein